MFLPSSIAACLPPAKLKPGDWPFLVPAAAFQAALEPEQTSRRRRRGFFGFFVRQASRRESPRNSSGIEAKPQQEAVRAGKVLGIRQHSSWRTSLRNMHDARTASATDKKLQASAVL